MERLIGFLGDVSGHTFDIIYDLLFTEQRVMVLLIQHPSDMSYSFGFKELLLGGALAAKAEKFIRKPSAEERQLAYKEKTLEELLAGHRFNFEIPYRMVSKAEVHQGLWQRRLKFFSDDPSLSGRNLHFNLTKAQIPEARKLIRLTFPKKGSGGDI
ncbi:MAG: hypothetical protein AB1585_11930 [Thermodesulfobacteriota bacterium]